MAISRRALLRLTGAGALAGTLPALARGAAGSGGMRGLPWAYGALDPDATGDRAFDGYQRGHCMYGAFEAIAGQVAERLGPPFVSFPFEIFTYGGCGVNGWATLCGALNGSAAAFQLLSAKPEPLIDALFSWYEREALPNYVPAAARFRNLPSRAGSPLCHASIAAWCRGAGKRSYSPERQERCGVLTAAVARQAVVLLNAQAAGKVLETGLSGTTAACMACHEKGGALEDIRSKMSCGGCHRVLAREHPTVP